MCLPWMVQARGQAGAEAPVPARDQAGAEAPVLVAGGAPVRAEADAKVSAADCRWLAGTSDARLTTLEPRPGSVPRPVAWSG